MSQMPVGQAKSLLEKAGYSVRNPGNTKAAYRGPWQAIRLAGCHSWCRFSRKGRAIARTGEAFRQGNGHRLRAGCVLFIRDDGSFGIEDAGSVEFVGVRKHRHSRSSKGAPANDV